jgi:hypothetical protein
VSLAVASEATSAVEATTTTTTRSADKFEPTTRDEIEQFASLAGIRVDEASSSVSSVRDAENRVVRTRHYVLGGAAAGVAVRMAFDVHEGSITEQASARDIAVTRASVLLTPVVALAELEPLVDAAEAKGAVGQLLRMIPRYARLAAQRRDAFAAARELFRGAACADVQQSGDSDFDVTLRCRPRGAHLFAFDVHWDIAYDAGLSRMRSTLSFVCHASPVADGKLADVEERFLQLVQQCGFLRALQIVLELSAVPQQ